MKKLGEQLWGAPKKNSARRREGADRVLAGLAIQALRAEPEHPVWSAVAAAISSVRPPPESILHWTRLAEPLMQNGRLNAAGWRLVA